MDVVVVFGFLGLIVVWIVASYATASSEGDWWYDHYE